MTGLPGDAGDPLRVSLQRLPHRLSILCVPDPNVSVVSTRCEVPLKRVPSKAQHPALVTDQLGLGQLRLEIPDPRGSVSSTGSGKVTRGRDGAAQDRTGVTGEGGRAATNRSDLEHGLGLAQDGEDVLGREVGHGEVASEVSFQDSEGCRGRGKDVGLEGGWEGELDGFGRLGGGRGLGVGDEEREGEGCRLVLQMSRQVDS